VTGGAAESAPGRVLVVIGTRPEAIKMAPVISALRAHESGMDTRVLFTGQHTDLVDQVLEVFDLDPHWNLNLMREGQSVFDVAEGCLRELRPVLEEWSPDLLLVQGDTVTVFFAALAGFFLQVPVGHVEAGLRSGSKRAPFPEEGLRRLTSVVADLHFAPTEGARENLIREGVPEQRIWVTGNPVVDALLEISKEVHPVADPRVQALLDEPDAHLILVTAHRRESFGAPLERIFSAVRALADREGVKILYPVHPNPNVAGPAIAALGEHPRIVLTEPLGYLDLVRAMAASSLILTDSGGIQEEAPTFGVPVLVLRDLTERPEGVEAGVAHLVGSDPERILATADRLLKQRKHATGDAYNPYGDGRAGMRIATIVAAMLADPARIGRLEGSEARER